MSAPDVPAPAGTSSVVVTAPAAAPDVTARRWPAVLLVVAGAVCLIVMVPLFRHGVVSHAFPSYVRDDPSYAVQRYSAPWIGGAVALGGLGMVCWAVAAGLLVRGRRHRAPVAAPVEAALAPRPTEAAHEF